MPSVAQQFADALKIRGRRGDGYIESEDAIVTWCVGHLVTMSYPDAYDMKFKRWSLQTHAVSAEGIQIRDYSQGVASSLQW